MGAGKTVLAKGICAGLGFRGEVISPSFVRVHRYIIEGEREKERKGESAGWNRLTDSPTHRLTVFHVDFYLVDSCEDAMDLGLEELFGGDNIVIVEWAQKFPDLIPDEAVWVELELGEDEMHRTIRVAG